MRINFLILTAFSVTGGLEKFNRAFMKALYDISFEQNFDFKVISSHDNLPDEKYVPREKFISYNGNKIKFALKCLAEAKNMDVVFIGHINLAPVAILSKLLNPKIKLILIGHGIEIWQRQKLFKKQLLKYSHKILAVSSFTKNRIITNNNIEADKILIFHNTIDPYFKSPDNFEKPTYLLDRYNIKPDTKIILTITRINKFESYKGYDIILETLPEIIINLPNVKYILGGKYDPAEKARLTKKIKDLKLDEYVILTGFIAEEELTDHYLLGDVFVLPSKKEGFGIVLIEAAACGLPVIAGNKDGSVDALLNGQIGKLVDPDNLIEIKESIIDTIENPVTNKQDLVIENFGFDQFKKKLRTMLIENL